MRRSNQLSLLVLSVLAMSTWWSVSVAEETFNPSLTGTDYFDEDDDVEEVELTLLSLELDVRLTPGYAKTTVIAVFQNPTDLDLEGEFLFEMPAHSLVTGYGLDVEGRMIDGVLAEKSSATRFFDDQVRGGIDPGLASTTRENAFTTRVFPIEPGQARTVSLEFVTRVDKDLPYTLPINIDQSTERLALSVAYESRAARPTIQYPGNSQFRWGVSEKNRGAVEEFNSNISGEIIIAAESSPPYILEKTEAGEIFLEVRVPREHRNNNPIRPSSVRVYWDSSMSQKDSATTLVDFVARSMEALAPDEIEVVTFADGALTRQRPALAMLAAKLDEVVYHGATNLEKLFREESGRAPADLCLLITDGRTTLEGIPDFQLPCRSHAISAAPVAARDVLALLAQRHRGQHIDLSLTDTVDALERVVAEPNEDITVVVDNEVIGRLERSDDDAGTRLLARLDREPRKIRVRNGNRDRRFRIRGKTATGGSIAAFWATRRLASMRATGAARQELVEVSRKYSVVTDETSFIVLEDIYDYLDAGITPPLHNFDEEEVAEYLEELEDEREEEEQSREERLDNVVEQWRELTAWYEASYTPRRATSPEAEPQPDDSGSGFGMFAAGSGDDSVLEELVVVTGSRVRNEPLTPATAIAIRPWSPGRPYLEAVDGICGDDFAQAYFQQRDAYGDRPSFYLEMGDAISRCGEPAVARDVLLSALELPTANSDTMTAVANRLLSIEHPQLALLLYEQVAHDNPERPQPWRDLALALVQIASRPETDKQHAQKLLQQAVAHLSHIIATPWDEGFDGIELIAAMEANRIVARLAAAGIDDTMLDPRLAGLLDVDLRIVITWNMDVVDMDLWVNEPTGERAMYSNPLTSSGGRLSNDMTQGYGPEEYLLRKAVSGDYEVRTNYFASDRLNPNGAIVVRAEIFRDWGRPSESVEVVDLEFTSDEDEDYLIATLSVKDGVAISE